MSLAILPRSAMSAVTTRWRGRRDAASAGGALFSCEQAPRPKSGWSPRGCRLSPPAMCEGRHQLISGEVNISGREEHSHDSAGKCSAVHGKGGARNTSRGLESAHDISAGAGAGEAKLKNASTPTARGRLKRETVSSQSASGNGSVREKRKIYDSEVCRHQGKGMPCPYLPVLGLSHLSLGSTPSSTINVAHRLHDIGIIRGHGRDTGEVLLTA